MASSIPWDAFVTLSSGIFTFWFIFWYKTFSGFLEQRDDRREHIGETIDHFALVNVNSQQVVDKLNMIHYLFGCLGDNKPTII